MNMHITYLRTVIYTTILLWLLLPLHLFSQTHDVNIIIHMRGVYESKVSLLALTGSGTFKPIYEVERVKNEESTLISVNDEYLPGEFVLRFDYKEKVTSTPYPSEKYIFINDQDMELWVNPKYCNTADSTYFQENERENAAFVRFSEENGRHKEKLGLLQNFLMNYDDTESKFYKQGIKEYEHRRESYNQWLKTQYQQDTILFVSSLYSFQYVPEIPWKGTEIDRMESLITHYFDGMDFNNPLIIRTSDLNKWMDNYVNLYGGLSTTVALRDSLFPLAGKTAIEKAKIGHPLVYGWMVDYFYRGYETSGIDAGMKILEPYLNDPNCLTTKRQEITKRLEGMKTLVAGSKAPNIVLKDNEDNLFVLDEFETQSNYILILFWSADCSHCVEMADKLYPWQQSEMQQKMMVVAISLDETETEIVAWEQKIEKLKGWKHMRAVEGINSKVANDYYILATPVMVLLDAKTKEIVAVPNTLNELLTAME